MRKLTNRWRKQGFQVGPKGVGALLKRRGFALQTAVRRRRGITQDPARRAEHCRSLAAPRPELGQAGLPVISVDTTQQALIGNFRNPGRSWCSHTPEVDEPDFPSHAAGVAVRLGVEEVMKHRGDVAVGLSDNTSECAVHPSTKWWQAAGRARYRGRDHRLILADGGGATGSRSAAWKKDMQEKLCDLLCSPP